MKQIVMPKRLPQNLLDKLKSFEFYVSLLFMKNVVMEVQEIEQDILASVEVPQQTRNKMLRMCEDDVAMKGIISAATEKCESYGIHVEYKFSKRHRHREHLPVSMKILPMLLCQALADTIGKKCLRY
jgi:hypothetical protein